jgi:hypothetical protein
VADAGIGDLGFKKLGGKLGTQLSLKIFTVLPSPIPQVTPWARSSRPYRILLHVNDEDRGFGAFQKSVSGKYLPFNTRAHKEFGSVNKRHPCLASIA